jgi:hypothetical protein
MWQDQVSPADLEKVVVTDCRKTIQWYFEGWRGEMSDGARYELELNEPWNTSRPHVLTEDNFRNTRRVKAQGWTYEKTRRLRSRVMPELEAIPPWADLLETRVFDSALVKLVFALYDRPGIQIANACKLLYQKRPRLVPILDQYARRAFNIPWVRGEEDAVSLAIRRIREVASYKSNAASLSALVDWLRECPEVTHHIPLSRLRILDILAWSTVQRRDAGEV